MRLLYAALLSHSLLAYLIDEVEWPAIHGPSGIRLTWQNPSQMSPISWPAVGGSYASRLEKPHGHFAYSKATYSAYAGYVPQDREA